MIGIIDTARLSRAYKYLSLLDRQHHHAFVCHSISLNSFIQLQWSRMSVGGYSILVRRLSDGCMITCAHVLEDEAEDGIISKIEKELLENGERPKCLICTQVSTDTGYCELCSIMMTNYKETCAICLDEQRESAVWSKTECGHHYHHECISKVNDNRCPLCRTELEEGIKII